VVFPDPESITPSPPERVKHFRITEDDMRESPEDNPLG
jgi:hypothetical protein